MQNGHFCFYDYNVNGHNVSVVLFPLWMETKQKKKKNSEPELCDTTMHIM